MRQFQVFHNPSDLSRRFAPFVIVMQSHHLSLDSVVVAPLVRDKLPTSIEPAVSIDGQPLVVALAEMGSVRAAALTQAAGDLTEYEDVLRRALERLFTGF